MLLLIDNKDSFTYNLAHYFMRLGQRVKVVRSDQVGLHDIELMVPDYLVISPGPGVPDQAGITLALIDRFAGRIPILGVCLGHQAIAQYFGARIIHAPQLMHGMTSPIYHQNLGIFNRLNSPFTATRYHSLLVDPLRMPKCLQLTASTQIKGKLAEVMGVRHHSLALEGVQFHPESVLTAQGLQLLANFLELYAK